MTPHYLDPKWRYHGAASHANAGHFARRQRERMREAKVQPAPANVRRLIEKRKASA